MQSPLLNDLILSIFESDEDLYFPIETQKEAKIFVERLNSKGYKYLLLCEEIEETENSFFTWKSGKTKSQTGLKVINRINQPIYDFLWSSQEKTEFKNETNEMETFLKNNKFKYKRLKKIATTTDVKINISDADVDSEKEDHKDSD